MRNGTKKWIKLDGIISFSCLFVLLCWNLCNKKLNIHTICFFSMSRFLGFKDNFWRFSRRDRKGFSRRERRGFYVKGSKVFHAETAKVFSRKGRKGFFTQRTPRFFTQRTQRFFTQRAKRFSRKGRKAKFGGFYFCKRMFLCITSLYWCEFYASDAFEIRSATAG